jgi:hypothetical protein
VEGDLNDSVANPHLASPVFLDASRARRILHQALSPMWSGARLTFPSRLDGLPRAEHLLTGQEQPRM